MDYIGAIIPDQASLYYYFAIAVCIVVILYLNDTFNRVSSYRGYDQQTLINYGYEQHNGPSHWRNLFVDAGGQKQSPINLITICAINIPSETESDGLRFSDEFNEPPYEMKLFNSGLNAVLYAKWCGAKRPSLSGGPLEMDEYTFLNTRFRWGPFNDEGSEHMINTRRFAMEMQVAFMKNGSLQCDILEAAKGGNLLILSYVFMSTPVNNPYLEPIIQGLKLVKRPSTCVAVCPFPLKLLAPKFDKNYFFYEGSLTFPPCTEGVKWIVQSEPLSISSRQVRKFRKLGGCSYSPLVTNARPVQHCNGREVFYYD